jgi:hypothetical protein
MKKLIVIEGLRTFREFLSRVRQKTADLTSSYSKMFSECIKFLNLFEAAQISTAGNESVFSFVKMVLTSHRSSLTADHVEAAVMVPFEARRMFGAKKFKLIDLLPEIYPIWMRKRKEKSGAVIISRARREAKEKQNGVPLVVELTEHEVDMAYAFPVNSFSKYVFKNSSKIIVIDDDDEDSSHSEEHEKKHDSEPETTISSSGKRSTPATSSTSSSKPSLQVSKARVSTSGTRSMSSSSRTYRRSTMLSSSSRTYRRSTRLSSNQVAESQNSKELISEPSSRPPMSLVSSSSSSSILHSKASAPAPKNSSLTSATSPSVFNIFKKNPKSALSKEDHRFQNRAKQSSRTPSFLSSKSKNYVRDVFTERTGHVFRKKRKSVVPGENLERRDKPKKSQKKSTGRIQRKSKKAQKRRSFSAESRTLKEKRFEVASSSGSNDDFEVNFSSSDENQSSEFEAPDYPPGSDVETHKKRRTHRRPVAKRKFPNDE